MASTKPSHLPKQAKDSSFQENQLELSSSFLFPPNLWSGILQLLTAQCPLGGRVIIHSQFSHGPPPTNGPSPLVDRTWDTILTHSWHFVTLVWGWAFPEGHLHVDLFRFKADVIHVVKKET